MKNLVHKVIIKLSALLPNKSIDASKDEWNKLAEENGRYYIVSKEGRGIDDPKFRQTGEENYQEHILADDVIKNTLGSFSDKAALEIGCGIGRLTEFLGQDFARVEGVDIAEKMIETAKSRLAHMPNVNFTATDGEHYPFADNTFDLVFSYIVFQHMPSREVILENFKDIKRVLKSTGVAKIQIRGGHKVRKGSWFYGPTFTKAEAEALMAEAGLTVVKMGDDSIKRFFLWVKK